MKNLKTIGDHIRFAITQFEQNEIYYGHGTDNVEDEARYLVLGMLNLPWQLSDNYLACNITYKEKKAIQNAIFKRTFLRIPTAYLVGFANFYNLKFKVDKRVLIPRSPIAELISHRFSPWLTHEPTQILDLCTGSGCIGIACAYEFSAAKIVLADVAEDALKVAQTNIKLHQLQQQVTLIKSDLFNNLHNYKFDVIVSNPPYVDAQDLADMPPEYWHEPHLGLEGGADGLFLVRKILACATNYLTDNGILIVEVGNSEKNLKAQYPDLDCIWLEFANGGEGVLLLTAKQCRKYQNLFLN